MLALLSQQCDHQGSNYREFRISEVSLHVYVFFAMLYFKDGVEAGRALFNGGYNN
jgi:hypothetical protein